jgi:hypothetical protein
VTRRPIAPLAGAMSGIFRRLGSHPVGRTGLTGAGPPAENLGSHHHCARIGDHHDGIGLPALAGNVSSSADFQNAAQPNSPARENLVSGESRR